MIKLIKNQFWLLLVFTFFTGHAQNAIKLIESNGNESFFILNPQQKFLMVKNELVIESENQSIIIEQNNSLKCEFCNYEISSLKTISGNSIIYKLSNESIEVDNLEPLSSVKIFDLNGNIIIMGEANNEGFISLNINELPRGILIINTNNKTFKFYKK